MINAEEAKVLLDKAKKDCYRFYDVYVRARTLTPYFFKTDKAVSSRIIAKVRDGLLAIFKLFCAAIAVSLCCFAECSLADRDFAESSHRLADRSFLDISFVEGLS